MLRDLCELHGSMVSTPVETKAIQTVLVPVGHEEAEAQDKLINDDMLH
jgi:hypothetical protein